MVANHSGLSARPLDELCGFILEHHHAYAHGAIPVIRGWLASLTPAEASTPLATQARAAFLALADMLASHLAKEENILFPALVAMAHAERDGAARPLLPFPTVVHPIRLMESEHARIEAAMATLRDLTHDFTPPEGASEALQRGFREMARLDAALKEHLHVEGDELFPGALELDRRLTAS
jgi:regulator of cell morphogenesis and NO signaling